MGRRVASRRIRWKEIGRGVDQGGNGGIGLRLNTSGNFSEIFFVLQTVARLSA